MSGVSEQNETAKPMCSFSSLKSKSNPNRKNVEIFKGEYWKAREDLESSLERLNTNVK